MTEVESHRAVPRSRLAALRVGELRALAAALGIGNTATLRKGPLVDAINEHYDTDTETETGTETGTDDLHEHAAPEAPDDQQDAVAPDGAADEAGDRAEADPEVETAAEAAAPVADPVEPATAPVDTDTDTDTGTEADADVEEEEAGAAGPTSPENRVDEAEGGAEISDEAAESSGTGEPKSAATHVNAGLTGIAEDLEELQRQGGDGEEPAEQAAEGERQTGSRRGRGRGRGRGGQAASADQAGAQQPKAEQQPKADQGGQQQPKGEQQPKVDQQPKADQRQPDQAQNGQNQQGQAQDGEGRRGRYRDRKRRGAGNDWDEPEIRDDDVLIPIAGILDVLDNYAFVRTSGYLPGPNDVYVSLGQVKKYHLRRGDAVVGAIRQVAETEQPSRQKYNALVKVDSINGLPVADAEGRVEFEKLVPLYPQERLRLETDAQKLTARVVDLVAPVGKGQRGLVIGPARSGRTLLLQAVANSITANNPEAHLMVVLVDERPEEVTEMQRTVKGEVIASTFDRPAEDHTTVAELAVDRAKRLVELGYDVVLLLDSVTRLARAYNETVPQSGRSLGGGLDAAALLPAKQFFGSARNIENGGSLTILATAITESGSRPDEVILEEFRGTANLELRLSGVLADKRIFPAIDITASSTRREEMLMGPDEVKVTWQLRRALASHQPQEALDVVLSKLRETNSNVEFLVQMQKSLPSGA